MRAAGIVNTAVVRGQKAPSTKRCIKTGKGTRETSRRSSQKAPNAKRCIKTCVKHPSMPT